MKKTSIYYIVLVILLSISIYEIVTFKYNHQSTIQFLFSFWAVILFIVILWSKKEFTRVAWFSKQIKSQYQRPSSSILEKEDTFDKEKYILSLPELNPTEKDAYIKLTELCCSFENQKKIIPFLQKLKDFRDDEEYMTTLNYVMEFLVDNDYPFIRAFDWKEEANQLEWFIKETLKENYNGLKVDFPKYNQDDDLPNVFERFNNALKKHHLQLGFIDTQSDEYVVFVHQYNALNEVKNLVNGIGYHYLSAEDVR